MIRLYQDLVGAVDGLNVTFTTPESFVAGTVRYFLNGIEYMPGTDYVEAPADKRISLLLVVPQVGDEHWVHFQVL